MHQRLQKIFWLTQRTQDSIIPRYVLAAARIDLISRQLDRFMNEEKPFLRSGYSIRDLADDIKIPCYQLSAFLNREIGLNFNDFLNHYRVWHCEELIQKGLVLELDLSRLALKCGFANRNTLSVAFKKYTGFTPSRYQRGWERLLQSEIHE